METTELEEQIYTAFLADSQLMSKLTQQGTPIYHLQKVGTDSEHYPYIVYSPLTDVPALTADDAEKYHRVTMRFHIVTKDGEYGAIYRDLKRILLAGGFMRVNTYPYAEDGEKILISDWRIGVDS